MFKKIWKHKNLLILLLTFCCVFLIYRVKADHRFRYLALGDSVALGQNPYGEISYGYADYLANYLEKNNLLKEYSKDFAQSGYRTKDILTDIDQGKTVTINGKSWNIKEALRESSLVTVSIGANDFLEKLKDQVLTQSLPSIEEMESILDDIFVDIDKTLKEIRKYTKGQIYVVGYYNPLPSLYEKDITTIDTLFAYVRDNYETICQKYNITYVDIYECMKKNKEYLPNPFDIHPSTKGYQAIANEIIDIFEKSLA